jgi:hypothetical protein
LGGAKVVIATVTNADAMTAVLGGLGANGVLMVIARLVRFQSIRFCSSAVAGR